MANPALIAKAAAIILTDEKARKAVGWTLVAILSPLILLIAFLCALGSGATEHNITAVELCFYDTIGIPAETPEEYRLCIEAMRASFAQLDIAIAAINENAEEGNSLRYPAPVQRRPVPQADSGSYHPVAGPVGEELR